MKRVIDTNFKLWWAPLVFATSIVIGESKLVLAVEPGSFHQRGVPLTLEQAINTALTNNLELLGSQARVDAAQGRAAQAGLWSNPELEVATEEGPARAGRMISDAKQTIGVNQMIPFPGKKKLDRQLGANGVRTSEAERALRRAEIIREVKAAFFRVLAAERVLEVGRELVRVAESSAATARKRVDAGAAADQEQLRAEILEEQARADLSDFERDLAQARASLAGVVGQPEWRDLPVTGALAETADPVLLAEPATAGIAAHPSMVASRLQQARSELELRRAKLEPYPDVSFGVAGGRDTDESSIVEFRVSVPVPIIDRGKGRQQEARAHVAMAEAEGKALEQRLLREWGAARQRVQTAASQVAAYRDRILPKANRALQLVQTGFDEGKFGLVDLLDTQRTTTEVRLGYQQKLLELNVAQAELEALIRPP